MKCEPPPAFLRACEQQGILLEPAACEALGQYLARMLETGAHTNLTAIRDGEEAWMRHVLDALTLLPLLDSAQTALDLGTGAGIPGMVLAICRPGLSFTLVDSVEKKCRFLEDCKGALGLDGVQVHHARAEDLGQDPAFREQYDLVLARAVSELRSLLELCTPLVRVGGRFIAMKGAQHAEELANAQAAMQALAQPPPEVIPSRTGPGAQLVFTKCVATPERYPRRAGLPKKRPL